MLEFVHPSDTQQVNKNALIIKSDFFHKVFFYIGLYF